MVQKLLRFTVCLLVLVTLLKADDYQLPQHLMDDPTFLPHDITLEFEDGNQVVLTKEKINQLQSHILVYLITQNYIQVTDEPVPIVGPDSQNFVLLQQYLHNPQTQQLSVEQIRELLYVASYFVINPTLLKDLLANLSTEQLCHDYQLYKENDPYKTALITPELADRLPWQSYGQLLQGSYVALSPDGQFIASGLNNGFIRQNTVRLYKYNPTNNQWETYGQPLHSPPLHSNLFALQVTSLAFSPDGQFLASGSTDNTIRLWKHDATNHQWESYGQPLEGHIRAITSVAFSPDSKILASGSADNTIILWKQDATNHQWEPYKQYSQSDIGNVHSGNFSASGFDIKNKITSIAFSPDGQFIASGSSDKKIRVWKYNAINHQLEPYGHTLQGHIDEITSVAFSPDGQFIASGSRDKTIRLWKHDTTNHQWQPYRQPLRDYNYSSFITSVAFSPDSQFIAGGSYDTTIRVWKYNAANEQWETYCPPLQAHKDVITSVAFSPDGQFIISNSRDNTIRLWHRPSVDKFCGQPYVVSHATGQSS